MLKFFMGKLGEPLLVAEANNRRAFQGDAALAHA